MCADTAFDLFIKAKEPSLRGIANKAGPAFEFADVCQTAWIMAAKIEQDHGYTIDFSKSSDQNLVVSWVYNELIRYDHKSVRYADSVDDDTENEHGPNARALMAGLLAAPADSDPLYSLEWDEEHGTTAFLLCLQRSYSEAAAYLILLIRVHWDTPTLAERLYITERTLVVRVNRAGDLARVQPTLFDGIETIDPDFRERPAAFSRATRTSPPTSAQNGCLF